MVHMSWRNYLHRTNPGASYSYTRRITRISSSKKEGASLAAADQDIWAGLGLGMGHGHGHEFGLCALKSKMDRCPLPCSAGVGPLGL